MLIFAFRFRTKPRLYGFSGVSKTFYPVIVSNAEQRSAYNGNRNGPGRSPIIHLPAGVRAILKAPEVHNFHGLDASCSRSGTLRERCLRSREGVQLRICGGCCWLTMPVGSLTPPVRKSYGDDFERGP